MNLSELNELEFSNIGNWPLPVKAFLILLVCAGVTAAFYYLDTKGQQERLNSLQQKETQLKNTVKVRAAKAYHLKEYEQQLADMQQSFEEMRRQLPNQTEIAALLVDISQKGLGSGLEFELFKPQPEINKGFYSELPIQIRVVGSYHQFGKFVSGVAGLPRIVTLHNIQIKTKSGKKGGGKLVMTATAKTYRYRDEAEGLKK